MVSMNLPQDFVDLLAEFAHFKVRVLVIGGYAVGAHGRPRATKDLDLFLEPLSEDVGERACSALIAFGARPHVVDALKNATPSDVVWFGAPPLRVDLLANVGGLDFEQAWQRRLDLKQDEIVIHVVGLDDLLALKKISGRPQDLADIRALARPNTSAK
jgi:predicted nucleotidyltransferase